MITIKMIVTLADESPPKSKVLILGAGATGLAAAYQLEQLGITDYLILEASDTIGGRMKSKVFGKHTVQTGPNWIQGTHGSWLWHLATDANLQGTTNNWDNIRLALDEDQTDYDYDDHYYPLMEDAWSDVETALNCMEKLSKTMSKRDETDMSLRQGQKYCGWPVKQNPYHEAVEWFNFDFEYADTPVSTSLKNSLPLSAYVIYQNADFQVTDNRGWLPIFDSFNISSSKILFNSMVTKINYDDDDGVDVTFNLNGTDITYSADYAICTFSLGVLQATHEDLFEPKLPNWYLREMYKFDMNVYTIIFMRFDETFWSNEEFFLYADERRGYYPIWQNVAKAYHDDEYHVISTVMVGEQAHRIARMTDAEIGNEAMDVLRTMFGTDIPDYVEIHVPRWLEDPLFHGSYSNWPIGTTEYDHVELGTPHKRLFIRGEATHYEFNGWIHGALEEGRQTARDIDHCMDDPESKFCKCAYNRQCNTYNFHQDTTIKQCARYGEKSRQCGVSEANAPILCCDNLHCNENQRCVWYEELTCSPENLYSKACGANGGRKECCDGLVCHSYTKKCVKEENKECAGLYTHATECGSDKSAAPTCCPGLECKQKGSPGKGNKFMCVPATY